MPEELDIHAILNRERSQAQQNFNTMVPSKQEHTLKTLKQKEEKKFVNMMDDLGI